MSGDWEQASNFPFSFQTPSTNELTVSVATDFYSKLSNDTQKGMDWPTDDQICEPHKCPGEVLPRNYSGLSLQPSHGLLKIAGRGLGVDGGSVETEFSDGLQFAESRLSFAQRRVLSRFA